jgi:SAM-dependent methyltransferase
VAVISDASVPESVDANGTPYHPPVEPPDGIRPEALPVRPGARGRLPLAERTDAPELLDSGGLSAADVAANLADLARLNRLPGGIGASLAAIDRLLGARSGQVRVLDAGTGDADFPRAFWRRGWRTVAIDTNPDVLRVAGAATAGIDGIEIAEADARRLPFDDVSFDVAHCSLLVHHLDAAAAITMLRELRRVARDGVVVNDLQRGPLAFVATVAPTLVLSRSHVTRHDGIASARRAYTLRELDVLLAEAGLSIAWRSGRWLPRVATAAR